MEKLGEQTKLNMAAVDRNVSQAKIAQSLMGKGCTLCDSWARTGPTGMFFSLISGRMPGQDQPEYIFF